MNKEKIDILLHGVSNVLDSLGDLAERGQQLKQAVAAAEHHSSADMDPCYPLTVNKEKSGAGWQLKISTSHLGKAEIAIEVQDNILQIKIIRGQNIDYKDIELTPDAQINSVNIDNDTGYIEIYYS